MQDRTINNALQAIRKQGGTEGKLAEVLLDMRGVGWTDWLVDQPLVRGAAKKLILNALKGGPKTTAELGTIIQKAVPDIGKDSAHNRAYQALRRLKDRRLVAQDFGPDGCLWKLAQ